MLMKGFRLPDQIAVLSHPYDHYFHLLDHDVNRWEKPLLQRNARSAFDLLETMIKFLHHAGYEFEFMSGLCDYLETQTLMNVPLEKAVK